MLLCVIVAKPPLLEFNVRVVSCFWPRGHVAGWLFSSFPCLSGVASLDSALFGGGGDHTARVESNFAGFFLVGRSGPAIGKNAVALLRETFEPTVWPSLWKFINPSNFLLVVRKCMAKTFTTVKHLGFLFLPITNNGSILHTAIVTLITVNPMLLYFL